jgi:hypothetical protein
LDKARQVAGDAVYGQRIGRTLSELQPPDELIVMYRQEMSTSAIAHSKQAEALFSGCGSRASYSFHGHDKFPTLGTLLNLHRGVFDDFAERRPICQPERGGIDFDLDRSGWCRAPDGQINFIAAAETLELYGIGIEKRRG